MKSNLLPSQEDCNLIINIFFVINCFFDFPALWHAVDIAFRKIVRAVLWELY